VLHGIYHKNQGRTRCRNSLFFPENFKLPFTSAQDLATKAAAELTHALLHPQPAGPFCKVGDEQPLALKRLADIFEGATRQKSRVVIPPTERVENVAPPMVQNTVSPPRVENKTAQQILPQQTISSHLMPNSHRIQHTPHRRAVTPPTPYVMVRRSAGQQYNLSQDMIAETFNQANHCFSISTNPGPKNTVKVKGNNQVILLPEMANAVICPETGKSLKHQELITKLRYKKIGCDPQQMNSIHTQIKYPKGAQSDIWLVCSGYPGPQGRKIAHQINRRRRSNLISRRQINTHRRFDHINNSHQQRHFNFGSQIPCH
jgi:hypothetical protein